MPARLARRFSAASRLAIGRACFTRCSPPGNSRSLITSISSSTTPDLSGTLPWRSSFLAGILVEVVHLASHRGQAGDVAAPGGEHVGQDGLMPLCHRHLPGEMLGWT